MAHFGTNIGKTWAAYYFNIWSHWIRKANIKYG